MNGQSVTKQPMRIASGDMEEVQFRHELKYLVSEAELRMVQVRLQNLMRRDTHTDETGKYLIRSLYFDDFNNTAYYENEDGVALRNKWRIRCYNASKDALFLENKQKEGAMSRKFSCPLRVEQLKQIMNCFSAQGILKGALKLADAKENAPLLNRFLLELKTRPLLPKVIVQYEREPYTFSSGNVRVTFDRHISSAPASQDLFALQIPLRPVMLTGQQMLEVKYDAYLPDPVYHAVQMRSMRQETFSKYYLCRRFNR